MDKIKWGTSRCSNPITHHHSIDDRYLCEHCVLVLWNPNEWSLLGSVASVQILTNLCQDLLNDIKDYASDQQLEMKWKLALDNHKAFEDILSDIKADLEKTIKTAQPKDLMKIQQRASDLKIQIEDSEVFSKYLVHKEMARLRFRDTDKDNELSLNKTARIISQAKTEEEKAMIRNRFEKVRHFLALEPKLNQDLEDSKLKHDAEIEDLKKSHNQHVVEITNKLSEEDMEIKKILEEEIVKIRKEKEDLLNKSIEIEQEFKKIICQLARFREDPPLLSYELKLNLILTINIIVY